MMDGRVKTLHPKVHGGILARRHRPDDLAAIAAQGIEPIDLVVVNLYPFARPPQNPDTPFDDLVEQIDIGGPRCFARPARTSATCWSSSTRRLPARARRARASRRSLAGVPIRADAEGVRAHGAIRHADRRNAADHVARSARRRPALLGAAGRAARQKCAICATARTRTRRPRGSHGRTRPIDASRGRSTRARSCRTRTCSISTPRCASRSSSPSRPRS